MIRTDRRVRDAGRPAGNEPSTVVLIGIDAAVDPRNNALTRGVWSTPTGTLSVQDLCDPSGEDEFHRTLAAWIGEAGETPILLCVDAPLGWPAPLADALPHHHAGSPLPGEANDLFRRITDREIRSRIGKTPLDVGADRIARAAHRTLLRIGVIADATGHRISLPLRSDEIGGVAVGTPPPPERGLEPGMGDASPEGVTHPGTAGTPPERPPPERPALQLLETYPAGWFVSEGIDTSGYRPKGASEVRETLLDRAMAAASVVSSVPREAFAKRTDSLDALICLFAGVDALSGRAPDLYSRGLAPLRDQIRREGWIWCKSRPS
ncbi:MAG: DUF429 domain-containing protein [Alkalispirochaeta sp.]